MSTDDQRKKAIEADLEKFAKKYGDKSKPTDASKVLDKSKAREK